MSFLPALLSELPWLRAELVLALLRLGRVDDAVEASLPLVGGEFQAWFLYARAWQKWLQGAPESAQRLLDDALRLRGVSGASVKDFVMVGGCPLLLPAFSGRSELLERAPTLTAESFHKTPQMLTTPKNVELLYAQVQPFLFACVMGLDGQGWEQTDHGRDPWHTLVLKSLDQPSVREEMTQRLHRLATRYPDRAGVVTSAAFYHIVSHEHREALGILQRCLQMRPYLSTLQALEVLCLYRLGRRHQALNRGARLLVNPRRDPEGLGAFILAVFAVEEVSFEVALRLFDESFARGCEVAARMREAVLAEL